MYKVCVYFVLNNLKINFTIWFKFSSELKIPWIANSLILYISKDW